MHKEILVLGSNGKTGKRVAQRLKAKNFPTRLASRNSHPAFDWEKPEHWEKVLTGVHSAYITFQPDLAVPSAPKKIQTFVQQARRCGIQKLVLLSGRGEKEAQACEQLIMASGIDYTIVRASWFMQNFSENFLCDGLLNQHMVLPTIITKEPFVDADDIADVVVSALTEHRHTGKIYELTGPELLSFGEATQYIASALHRDIAYTEIPMNDYCEALKIANLPEEHIWLIRYLFTEVLDGRNASLSGDIEHVLQRKPGSFKDFVSKTIKTGVWDQR